MTNRRHFVTRAALCAVHLSLVMEVSAMAAPGTPSGGVKASIPIEFKTFTLRRLL